jgi:hypothetical protein
MGITFRPRRAARRLGASTFAALGMALVVSGAALAASWSAPDKLSSSGWVFQADVATMSAMNAVAAYVESDGSEGSEEVWLRRTTDGGVTWGAPLLVAAHGQSPAVAAKGMNVDLVWNALNGRVRYARSTDGGQTFGPARFLSPLGRFAWRPAVARGPGGIVAAIYEDVQNGNVAVRVSTDGGMTFAPADILTGSGGEAGLAVAIGDGVIYAAYSVGSSSLRVKRSLNNGETWSDAARITNNLMEDGISLTAAGTHAYVAYTGPNDFPNFSQVRYRRTVDRGAHWSSPMPLASDEWTTSDPDLGFAGGAVHATFTRCVTDIDYCYAYWVVYRRSTNGLTWGRPLNASPASLFNAYEGNVGSHRGLVTYLGEYEGGLDAFARTRLP